MSDLRKLSVEEIIAYCRNADGEGGGDTVAPEAPSPATEEAATPEPVETADAPAAEEPKPAASSAAKDPKSMSVAEMLAAARAEKSSGAAKQEEPAAEKSPAEESPAAAPAKDPKKMSVAEMLAAARGEKAKPAAPKTAAKPKPKAAPAKSKAAAKPEPTKREGPKDTASILAAARGEKPGPISKAEAAARKEEQAKPKGKEKIVVPPMPAKPEYAQARPAQRAATEDTDRRGFFATIGGALFGSSLSIAFTALSVTSIFWVLGLARYMFPNVLTEPPTKFKVGFPDTLSPGQVEAKYKAQFGVWIVRAEYGGQQVIYALKSVCTHLGCTPNWLEGEQKFKCPCHGSGFYKTGVNFEGPAPRPLERFAIKVADDGQLEVDKSQLFLEDKGQWTDPASFVSV